MWFRIPNEMNSIDSAAPSLALLTDAAPKADDEQSDLDYAWIRRLIRVHTVAIASQHELAYLSTLGGAYHLCKLPTVALVIANRMFSLGKFLGSTRITMKSRVYRASNFFLLGDLPKALRILRRCQKFAEEGGWDDVLEFTIATKEWVLRNADSNLLEGQKTDECSSRDNADELEPRLVCDSEWSKD